jgi:TRAP-type transport system periplasmic protein
MSGLELSKNLSRRDFLLAGSAIASGALVFPILEACGQGSSPTASGPKITIRLGHHLPVGNAIDIYAHDFADRVSSKTNGLLTIQIYPSAELGAEQDAIKAVQLGTLDMTVGTLDFLSDFVPEAATLSQPFLIQSWAQALKVVGNGGREPYAVEVTKRVLAASNVRLISWGPRGFRSMFFRDKHVTDLPGMKGLKMRAPALSVQIDMYKLLGANPIAITFSEFYTAMQTGVVAGMDDNIGDAIGDKVTEVAKYCLLTNCIFAYTTHMMNKSVYSGLPADYQKAVSDAAVEAALVDSAAAQKAEEGAVQAMQGKGLTVDQCNDLPAWKAATAPIAADWTKTRPGAASLLTLISAAAS